MLSAPAAPRIGRQGEKRSSGSKVHELASLPESHEAGDSTATKASRKGGSATCTIQHQPGP